MAVQGGFGLDVKITVGTVLTTIVNVVDCRFPKQSRTVADITAHDSADGYAEWVATGRFALEEFEMELVWDDTETTHAQLLTELTATSAVEMSIADPAGNETITFDAWITGIERVSEQEEGYKAIVTVQPTGAPAIT